MKAGPSPNKSHIRFIDRAFDGLLPKISLTTPVSRSVNAGYPYDVKSWSDDAMQSVFCRRTTFLSCKQWSLSFLFSETMELRYFLIDLRREISNLNLTDGGIAIVRIQEIEIGRRWIQRILKHNGSLFAFTNVVQFTREGKQNSNSTGDISPFCA
jgi:hypothetical protein